MNGKFTRVSVSQLVCLAEVKPGTDCDWELQDETIQKRDERRADLERQEQGELKRRQQEKAQRAVDRSAQPDKMTVDELNRELALKLGAVAL